MKPESKTAAAQNSKVSPEASGSARTLEDSLGPIMRLGNTHRSVSVTLALAGALLIHGSAGAHAATSLFDLGDFARRVHSHVIDQLRLRYDIDVDPPPPEPEPEPEPEPAPEPEAPPEPKAPDPETPPPLATDPPPAPEAAEAGKVLTAEPDPNEPLDLTDQGFMSGSGTRFAGGVTAADGTSDKAVRNRNARAGGVPAATGAAPTAAIAREPSKDLSTPAKPIVSGGWNCPFPPESNVEQVNFARVTMVVLVDTNGRAKSATVLSDPGFGFGRAARSCAMGKQYSVAKNKTGDPVAQTTPPFVIKFTR